MTSPTRYAWLAALLLALAFIAIDSAQRIGSFEEISSVPDALVASPTTDAASPTGYENGQRHLILPRYGIDGYHWLMQTQQMFATGDARIRHVDYDNAPDGREVHWASPFRWWLGLFACIDHAITDAPIGQCVERAGLYANPLLLAVFLIALAPYTARHLGGTFSTWLTLGSLAALPFADYFGAGNPDHHGLVAASALLSVLGLLIAVTTSNASSARNATILSALAGAFGLWISSASQVPVLLALGLGSLAAAWLKNPAHTSPSLAPSPALWRLWGRIGAAASLATWLIEYFPSHLSWRLEVNHPLYALAWLGGGELLRLAWLDRRPATFFRSLASPTGALSLLAVITLPAVIVLSGTTVFRLSSPFLWSLHHEYISEFQNLPTVLAQSGFAPTAVSYWLPWLLLLAAIPLWKKTPPTARTTLLLAAAPALIFAFLGFNQARWNGFAQAFLLLFLATLHRSLPAQTSSRLSPRLALAFAACLALTPLLWRFIALNTQPHGASKNDIIQLANREVAHWLNRRTGPDRAVVATSPGLSTPLAFHGGVKTLGTFYWENLDGLEASASFFSARNEAEAHRIAQATGITHLVLVSWSDFVEPYVKLIRGLKKDDPAPTDAFVLNLLDTKTPPPWLRPVPCVLPSNPGLDDTAVFVYEVVQPQSREESLARLVQFLIDTENLTQAVRFLPALEQYPQFPPAQIARARIQLLREDNAAFLAAMRELLLLSPRFPALALEDRVQLALLLAVVGDDTNARREFSRCWTQASENESAFRKLPPASLVYLLQQSTRLSLTPPAGLDRLARTLLPPQWLAQLQ
ncbi:hypothetical protein CMV30_08915 [Nibricoccus aquaticus]|uniref:Uncharacterized protein n=1 Tax=Nibricoccus aquaticus TaxID=2576891 RepID=A0A290QJL0_9BACT|nr:hypothetical protein [Nibricoccus aquaticus]ATC64062.1 hypothetical protein CMV30_08915 [Nibricoccus aquaticus]